jgi:hypothetical protein
MSDQRASATTHPSDDDEERVTFDLEGIVEGARRVLPT